MKLPCWITREVLVAIQAELVARFGGLRGLRDSGLLDSALERPRQVPHYAEPDLFDLAAVYAEGIVKNHPFVDGNKRAGFMAAYTYLAANGYQLLAPEEQAVLGTRALAAGETSAEAYAQWLRSSCTAR